MVSIPNISQTTMSSWGPIEQAATETLPQQQALYSTAMNRIGWRPSGAPLGSIVQAKQQAISMILLASINLPIEDQAILLSIAEQESSFNFLAKNKLSSAHGIFQITNGTWHGLHYSPEARFDLPSQVAAGVALYRENLGYLQNRGLAQIHGAERLVELYVLHHDGPTESASHEGREIAIRNTLPRFQAYQAGLR